MEINFFKPDYSDVERIVDTHEALYAASFYGFKHARNTELHIFKGVPPTVEEFSTITDLSAYSEDLLAKFDIEPVDFTNTFLQNTSNLSTMRDNTSWNSELLRVKETVAVGTGTATWAVFGETVFWMMIPKVSDYTYTDKTPVTLNTVNIVTGELVELFKFSVYVNPHSSFDYALPEEPTGV